MPLLPTQLLGCPKAGPEGAPPTPVVLADRRDVVEDLHGVEVHDPYRWLEDAADPEVVAWADARNAEFRASTDALPIRSALYDRAQQLLRYDDQTVRASCLLGSRKVWRTKRADQDKWVVHLAEGDEDPGRVVVDPNTWGSTETLEGFWPSPDCRFAVVGRSRGGDEDAVLTVMDLDTLEVLPDTFRGWKHQGVAWRHDNSGFWYSARPLASEKADGGHFYFLRTWWHALRTQGDADQLVFWDDQVKELMHGVSVSEDGRWLVLREDLFNADRVWLQDLQGGGPRVPVTTELDARHHVDVVDGKLVAWTDWQAPRGRLLIGDPANPGRDRWRELVPEGPDRISSVDAVGGRLYVSYQHDVHTEIRVFDLEGKALGTVPLPTLGSATVSGWWSRPEVRVAFTSFATPPTDYRWDPVESRLTLEHASAVPVEPEVLERIEVEQAWFHSKDGTAVPMFVLHPVGAHGPLPTLLTGYGGFDRSMDPQFGLNYLLWLERGGVVAIPSLRGGGEFGKAWHEAGMLDRKQNVFDDFLGAAQWLIDEGWTTPGQLAISGGSNGGLLVSAAVTQRPDLFGAVLCTVPLTDMLRYQKYGIGKLWSEEYGTSDDPAQVGYLRAYSPYHNVVEGTNYPAMLIVASVNDARTDPAHARKFFAAVQWADVDHGATQPILLWSRADSGHHGAVTIDERADQIARPYGFLMHQVGLDSASAP